MADAFHAYPAELAKYARERWPPSAVSACPPPTVLEELLSTAYHASLLREEERPVNCRVLFLESGELPETGGPPTGLHRLVFDRPRPYTDHELRRLSPAAKYPRALIGVHLGPAGKLEIWGIVQSGPRWMLEALGARTSAAPLPRVPVARISGPGRIALACGSQTIAELRGGRLTDVSMDVFASDWLSKRFADLRRELTELHAEAERSEGARWAKLEHDVLRLVSQHVLKRLIATIRSAHHGGAVLLLPAACIAGMGEGRFVQLKYAFRDEEPRRRYRTLALQIMRTLAEGTDPDGAPVGWDAYRTSQKLADLDEALVEISHLFAALADVDGAVVVSEDLEFLGFGGEITGDLPHVDIVERALDLEGGTRVPEVVDSEGTRHRSAYRLCARFHDALALVVSQDGAVRFIAWHEGAVTYWDHGALGAEA